MVILTKNEAANLPGCLTSLARKFEDVHVVDSNSVDATAELAISGGAHVTNFTWNREYPRKKQWSLDHLPFKYTWVLQLDADERLSPELLDELQRFDPSTTAASAFDATLDYTFLGRTLQHGHKATKRILLHKGECRFPVLDDLAVSNMWEVEGHYQPVVDGQIGRLEGRLLHADEDSLFDYFHRHNRYSDWEAYVRFTEIAHKVALARSARGALFAKLPGKPVTFFIYAYLLRSGWRDGRAGLAFALANSFYYWQISVKLQELHLKAVRS